MLSLYGDLKRYQSFRFISTGSNSMVSVSGVGLKRRDPFFATQRPRQSRSRKIQSVYFQSSLTWSNWRPTQSNHVKRAIWCSKTANASCQMQSIPFQPREGQICLGLQRYHPQLSTTRSFKKVKSEPYQFYITLSQLSSFLGLFPTLCFFSRAIAMFFSDTIYEWFCCRGGSYRVWDNENISIIFAKAFIACTPKTRKILVISHTDAFPARD